MAKIVGELGVEITADSTGLAADIKAKVEAAVREAATSQLALSVDTGQLARQLQTAIKAAKDVAGSIKIGVQLTDDGFIPAVEAEVKKAQALAGDVKFGVTLGVAGVDQAQLAAEVRKSLSTAQASVPALVVKIELDDTGLVQSVQVAIKKAQAEVSKVKIGLDIDSAGLIAKVKLAAAAASESSTIKPKVDPKTAQADFEAFANNLKSKLSDITSTVNGGIASAFRGLFQIAKWDTIIVGAAQAAQSVITLSGALGVIPGAVLAAGGALVTLKIGTQGVAQAIKDIGTPQFTADMQKLAPAARDTVNAIAGLKPALTGLKLDVQNTLFAGFGSQLKDLAGNLLPTVRAGLVGFADSLNKTAQGIFTFFSASSVKSDLANTFSTAQASVLNLGAALPAVLSILRDLGVVGSQAFASLTGGAAGAAQKVADFISQSRQSGSLANFINDGVKAFKQLADVVGNVIIIVSDLIGALGGGGIIGLLLTLTTTLKNFLNSASGSAALAALGAAMQQIASSAGQVLLALLTNIGQILADHAPDIAAFAKALGDNLVSAINTLAPIISGLLNVIGANPTLFADIAIGAVALAGALNVLVPIVTIVAALVGAGTIGLVAAIIAAVIAAVVLIIVNFDTIKSVVGDVLNAIGSFFVFLGTTIANAFGSAVAFVEGIWNGVVGFFAGIGTAIGTAVSTAVAAVGQFFADGFNAVVGFIGGAITSIVNFFVALPGQVVTFIAAIPQAFVDMTNAIAFAVGFGLGAALRFFIDLPGNVINAVISLATTLGQFFADLWNNAVILFAQGVVNVINFVTTFPGQVINTIGVLGIQLALFINNLWNNAVALFQQGVSNVVSFVTGLPNQVISAVLGLRDLIVAWAIATWANAKNSFVTGVNNIVNFVRNLPGQIIDAIGSLGSRLFSVGVDALNGLLNGLRSIAGSILSWVGGLVSNILHGFTSGFDSHSPSRETYAIGQDVAQGLANALRDAQGLVGAAAGDLAQAGLDGLSPILNPTVNTAAIATGISAATNALTTNPAGGVNYTVNQTNLMQQGTDVNQFADAVLKNGAAALASGSSLIGVTQLGTQAGINPNFLAVSGV